MKKLPIGIHTFSKIIETDCLYIDKTKEAYELINSYQYVFLSRPRRFGKSLFLTTLKEIFEGNKELFKGLYIYDKYDFEKYPVIRIVFSGKMFTKDSLDDVIKRNMRNNEENLQCEIAEHLSSTERFAVLIKAAYKKYNKPVVILIDEYDKPILDNITDKEMRNYARNMLKGLYEHIKYNDEYVKFAFLTGVSKFSKVSIFSGLNNLEDISLHPEYGNICGYTQADLESTFKPFMEGVDMEKVKRWYDGYNFLKDNVYNPFDILKFCARGNRYENYWFESGSPSFLIELIKEKNYYVPQLENITIGEGLLNSFDIENIDLEVLLYQSGYLTIRSSLDIGSRTMYELQVPNLEVRTSLNDIILTMFTGSFHESIRAQNSAYLALEKGDMEAFKASLISLFASLPYQNYAKNNISVYEGFYASVVYAFLASLAVPLIAEDNTNRGRIDITLKMEHKIYIIEFKVGNENALQQIKEKRYYEKYSAQNKEIYILGINFDEKERNISGFEWEKC